MGFFVDREGYPRAGRIIVVAVALIVLVPIAVWGFMVATASIRGAGNAHRQTETADYRIANYERFKNDCNAIVATEGKIALAQQAVDNEVKGAVDSFREQQLTQNLQALQNVRLEQVTEYNADASKTDTRAKFLDSALPYYINPNGEIGAVECPSE